MLAQGEKALVQRWHCASRLEEYLVELRDPRSVPASCQDRSYVHLPKRVVAAEQGAGNGRV